MAYRLIRAGERLPDANANATDTKAADITIGLACLMAPSRFATQICRLMAIFQLSYLPALV